MTGHSAENDALTEESLGRRDLWSAWNRIDSRGAAWADLLAAVERIAQARTRGAIQAAAEAVGRNACDGSGGSCDDVKKGGLCPFTEAVETILGCVFPPASCGCPVSGFGYRHHRHPCPRAGENECVIPPGDDLIGTCPDGSRCQTPHECVAARSCTRPDRHTLKGTACSCGEWKAELGESIHRGFDRHLLESRDVR